MQVTRRKFAIYPSGTTTGESAAYKTGDVVGRVEDAAVNLASNRIYRLRLLHPWAYGIIAFLIGGFIVGTWTMTSYGNWAYEGINLKLAFWQVVWGSLGGGAVMVALAFAYARMVRPALRPMEADGIIPPPATQS